MSITIKDFGTMKDGRKVSEYIVKNAEGCGYSVLNYGGYLKNLWIKDKNGQIIDVCLGFDTLAEYEDGPAGSAGGLIGRVGNRIGGSAFDIDGVHYTLTPNDGANNLHGGPKGFHLQMWQLTAQEPSTVVCCYHSADGEMGFPGNLNVEVRYSFADNALRIEYHAQTDKPTLCNLTNHAYFNLDGKGDILSHVLQINASHVTEVTPDLIPTGRLILSENVPYDFSAPTVISKQIARLNDHDNSAHHGGVDFNYCCGENGVSKKIATLYSENSGIEMTVTSDQPAVQIYMGMCFHTTGKNGQAYKPFAGIALETQHYPDAPHHDNFPSIVLRPGESYDTFTTYSFRAI